MFFCVLIFFIIITIIILSKVTINIQNLKVLIQEQSYRKINKDYKITISWCIFKNTHILKTEVIEKKLKKLKLKERIKKINIKDFEFNKLDKEKIKQLNKHKPKIKFIQLSMNVGLDDAAITSYIVAILSSLLGIILKNTITKSKESKFIVNPIFTNKNLLDLELNCIIELKLIHIIYIIYILNKKRRDDKYGRASNRRSYGYSYE